MPGQILKRGKAGILRKNITGLRANSSMKNLNYSLLWKRRRLQDKEFLKAYIKEIRSILSTFSGTLKGTGLTCLEIFNRYQPY